MSADAPALLGLVFFTAFGLDADTGVVSSREGFAVRKLGARLEVDIK
jgi:hypothetical protein